MRHQWGAATIEAGSPAPFPNGAGLAPAAPGGTAYLLIDDAHHRSLGGALAWALRHQAGEVHLIANPASRPDTRPDVAAVLARRAQTFTLPVTVWLAEPPSLREVAPAGYFPPPALPSEAAGFAEVLRTAGVDPVVEFGVLTGEFLGLEVAKVIDGRLEVGVGNQDRAFHRDLEPNRLARDVLAEVVALIRRFRVPGGSAHLANSLAVERWLRHVLIRRPDLVGAAFLAPLPPAVPRVDLRTTTAAMAAGVDFEGKPLVVAASAGIDLDVVAAAADARQAHGLGDARLIVALPQPDDHPRTRQLAALLRDPAEVVIVPPDWKSLAGTL